MGQPRNSLFQNDLAKVSGSESGTILYKTPCKGLKNWLRIWRQKDTGRVILPCKGLLPNLHLRTLCLVPVRSCHSIGILPPSSSICVTQGLLIEKECPCPTSS